ncbi:phosphoglycerate dehydrogenase [bacterium]|nr:phosphoglycerate dehydrogenase [bacterium]
MAKKKKIFVLDFDSTLVQVEALDELARISLRDKPYAEETIREIQNLSHLAMRGELSFPESLERRIKLLEANRKHLKELTATLKRKITPSFQRNKAFFKKYHADIFVVTGGFYDYVLPVISELHIKDSQVFANSFVFDNSGNIIGFDKQNVLAQEKGKVKQLEKLGLGSEVTVIGDGATDLEMRQAGVAEEFVALTENVSREKVVDQADSVAKSFDEVLYTNNLPRKFSYPKSKIKVLLLEGIDPEAADRFKADGYQVDLVHTALDEDELIKALKDVSILGIRSKTKVTKKVLEAANRLLAIGAFCIGTDQIDTINAARQGVIVFNAPYSNTRSVVELAIGNIIMLLRKVFPVSLAAHGGAWLKSADGSYEVRGKKLGIIGYGNIGSQLSVLAENLGMEVYYYDIVEKLSLGNAKRCRTLNDLLKISDIVTIHVDGRAANQGLLGKKELGLMKKGAYLLNIARGHVIEIEALADSLRRGHLAGAAVDVFPKEPKNKNETFTSPLQGLTNVILTPHIGGSTVEAQYNIGQYTTGRLLHYINCGESHGSVNFPEIQAAQASAAHRLLHIHKNVPGILAQVNGILSEHKINILGQYLRTNEEIGYLVTDVNKKYNSQVIEELKNIPNTIKFRILY